MIIRKGIYNILSGVIFKFTIHINFKNLLKILYIYSKFIAFLNDFPTLLYKDLVYCILRKIPTPSNY